MRKILLTRGKHATVDNEDYEYLSRWKWHCSSNGYAVRRDSSTKCKQGKMILMHRVVNKTPNNLDTDHINRNKLDNRRCNLKSVNVMQNMMNREVQRNSTTGYKGIYWSKQKNRWQAKVVWKSKQIHLGFFKTIKEAIFARLTWERRVLLWLHSA